MLDFNADAFTAAEGDWDFVFPRDQAPHLDHRGDVWDLSGQLVDSERRRYGLRLTFLRIGLADPAQRRTSALAADSVLLARFALAPEEGPAALSAQRSSRAAAGLAGAQVHPFRLWLEDWSLAQGEGDDLLLQAGFDDLTLALRLMPQKSVVTEAQAGLLANARGGGGSAAQGPGFHFYLQPRLAVEGRLLRGGRAVAKGDRNATADLGSASGPLSGLSQASTTPSDAIDVTGTAWLEHAWGSVSGGLIGQQGQLTMNRFSLQLDDDTELFCVQLRRRSGGGTPVPTCVAIAEDGGTRLFPRRELTLEPRSDGIWFSPDGGARYPLRWRLVLPALGLDVAIDPLLAGQELEPGAAVAERTWSGVVTVSGSRDGDRVTGSGRMDLSGYGTDLGT